MNYRHPGPRRLWKGARAAVDDTTSAGSVAAVAAVTSSRSADVMHRHRKRELATSRLTSKSVKRLRHTLKGPQGGLKATLRDQKPTTWRPLRPTLDPLGTHLANFGRLWAHSGSGIPDPESWIQDPGSRIRDPGSFSRAAP